MKQKGPKDSEAERQTDRQTDHQINSTMKSKEEVFYTASVHSLGEGTRKNHRQYKLCW